MRNNSGFTLIEVVIGMAIIAFLAGLGLFLSMDFYRGYSFNYERSLVVAGLQKARSRAMANINQAPHGFCRQGDEYIVFEGDDCDSGAEKDKLSASNNIDTDFSGIASNINGGLPEIVFKQLSGDSETTGNINLTGEGKIANISINEEGAIDY